MFHIHDFFTFARWISRSQTNSNTNTAHWVHIVDRNNFYRCLWEVYQRTTKVLLSQYHLLQNDLCSDLSWPMSELVSFQFPFTLVKALSACTRVKVRYHDLSNRLLSSGQTSLSNHSIHISGKTKQVSRFRYIQRMCGTCHWPFNRLVLRAPFGRLQLLCQSIDKPAVQRLSDQRKEVLQHL